MTAWKLKITGQTLWNWAARRPLAEKTDLDIVFNKNTDFTKWFCLFRICWTVRKPLGTWKITPLTPITPFSIPLNHAMENDMSLSDILEMFRCFRLFVCFGAHFMNFMILLKLFQRFSHRECLFRWATSRS